MPPHTQHEHQFFQMALALQAELRRVLFSFTHSDSDAEDLLQDVYLKLLNANGTAPMEERSTRAYCLKTARNVARDWLRHRKIVSFEPLDDEVHDKTPDEQPDTDRVVGARQELQQAVSMLKELSPQCEAVVTRRRIHGESIQTIADELKITKNTVKFHLAKGDRSLRDKRRAGSPSSKPLLGAFRRRRKEDL